MSGNDVYLFWFCLSMKKKKRSQKGKRSCLAFVDLVVGFGGDGWGLFCFPGISKFHYIAGCFPLFGKADAAAAGAIALTSSIGRGGEKIL